MFEAFLLAGNIWLADISPSSIPERPVALDFPVGLDTWLSPDVWSIPVYMATSSDPVQPLLYNGEAWSKVASGIWRRSGNSIETEKTILATSTKAFPPSGNVFSSISATAWLLPPAFSKAPATGPDGAFFRAGEDALPAPGPDGHMVIRQPDNTVLETYATIRLSTGQIVALSYGVSALGSAGDGYQNGQTASMIPSYLGLIDDEEIEQGHIDHAIAITVPAKILTPKISYPAFAFDRNALTQHPVYGGSLPMGSRLAIPMTYPLDGLQLRTPAGRIIAAAAQRHGFIIVDRGGEGITLRVRRNSPDPTEALHKLDSALAADLRSIFSHLVIVPPPQDAAAP